MNKQKKGFTLVELSIVLVIIGLLIGGILAAQSMINTAKIQALVRQVGQFDAAVENFQTKYQQLPGDTNLMGNTPGNNDGIIRGAYPFQGDSWQNETAKYWADLSNSGLTKPTGGNYEDDSTAGSDITVNTSNKIPPSTAGKQAYFLAAGTPPLGLNYIIGQPTTLDVATFAMGINPAFKPADALAVDQKLDDGLPATGNVKGYTSGTDTNTNVMYLVTGYTSFVNNSNPETCTNGYPNGGTQGTAYLTTNVSEGCVLLIRIGISTGNLK